VVSRRSLRVLKQPRGEGGWERKYPMRLLRNCGRDRRNQKKLLLIGSSSFYPWFLRLVFVTCRDDSDWGFRLPASWLQGWLPVTVQLGLSALPGLAPGTVTELSSVEVRGVRTVTAMPVQSLGPIHDDRPMSWTILGLLGGSLRDRPRV